METEFEFDGSEMEEAPSEVFAVNRLRLDLTALSRLMSAEVPPTRKVRSWVRRDVFYGFGDASATGYGDGFSKQNTGVGERASADENAGVPLPAEEAERVKFVHGQWATEICEMSSNFRELVNLVKAIKRFVDDGTLRG